MLLFKTIVAMDQKIDVSEHNFEVVLQKITDRERHHGAFFYAQDQLKENALAFAPYQATLFQRLKSNTAALLFRSPISDSQHLLGYGCLEEHLTLDEWFIKRDAVLAAAHYRGLFQYDQRILKIGVYFGADGTDIYINIQLVSDNEEKPFPTNNPQLQVIIEAVKSRWLPFQNLFLKIIEEKKKELSTLIRKTLKQDTQIIEYFTENRPNNEQIIQQIHTLIQDIEKTNRYNDNMRDLRGVQYADLLEDLKSPPDIIVEDEHFIAQTENTESIEKETNAQDKTAVVQIPKPKDKREKNRKLITQLVDDILQDLDLKLDKPKHEQFILVMNKLEHLEFKCFYFLFAASPDEVQFVKNEKARLNFVALSLDDYFSKQVESGNIEAVQALLPFLLHSKKLAHYYHLIKAIEHDLTGSVSTVLCQTASYLRSSDPEFASEIETRQRALKTMKINDQIVTESILITLFRNNNLAGFLFFLKNHPVIHDTQFIFNGTQYHLLEACILFYDLDKTDLIRALFDHGIEVSHPFRPLPAADVEKLRVKPNKRKHQVQVIAGMEHFILNITKIPEVKSENGLDFATTSRPHKLELIKEIAAHAPLELLLVSLARISLAACFSAHFSITNTPFFGLAPNKKDSIKTFEQYPAEQDNIGIGCMFYNNGTRAKEVYLEQANLFGSLYHVVMNQHKQSASTEQIREICNSLIKRCKETTEQCDKLLLIHAGFFAWTMFPEYTELRDTELILRLLGLRGLVASRIYRDDSDKMAYYNYHLAIQFVQYSPKFIAAHLQTTSTFEILAKTYEQVKNRIKTRIENTMFTSNNTSESAPPNPLVTDSSSVAASKSSVN